MYVSPDAIATMSSDSARTFTFPASVCSAKLQPYMSSDAQFGWREFQRALIAAGADSKFANDHWVSNHYRWIVWKLACEDRVLFRQHIMTTPERVLEQLKLRYGPK